MTHLMYHAQPDLFETTAHVTDVGTDSRGDYIVCNQSAFYPQGGGQPADQGYLVAHNVPHPVYDVRMVDGDVRHYCALPNNLATSVNDVVTLRVDATKRALHARYHTAGHLIAAVAERLSSDLRALKGHQFPGEAYVLFEGILAPNVDFLTPLVHALQTLLKQQVAVSTEEICASDALAVTDTPSHTLPEGKKLRVCQIGAFSPVPCGGTHVKTLGDLKGLVIKKIKAKKGHTKIHYAVP